MERTYDIFEIRDGQPLWREAVSGIEPALAHMRELAAKSDNEFRLPHVSTSSLIAVLNAKNPLSGGVQPQKDQIGVRPKLALRVRRFRSRTLRRFKSRPGRFASLAVLTLSLFATAHRVDAQNSDAPRAGSDGATMPKCEYCPDPGYSQEARKKNFEGAVDLLIVVTPEGRATDIRVTKSPGLGLDAKAIEAVRKWKFKPASKDGKPIATQVPVEITFRLH